LKEKVEIAKKRLDMRGLNKVTLIGNLGKVGVGPHPGVQALERGVGVAKFSVATTGAYRDKQGDPQSGTGRSAVAVAPIVAWRSLAEVAGKYLHKGSTIYLEGKLKARSHDDKGGHKKYVAGIVAEQATMPDKRKETDEPN
jgi:single-strand DNA-binding protein